MAMTDASEQTARGSGGRWLQLGLISATVAAPLIARWRSLREDDRTQALRERAEELRDRASTRLAGAARAARALQRSLRRQRAGEVMEDPDAAIAIAELAPLAALVPDDAPAEQARGPSALRATFWLVGVSAGLIAAGALTYIIIRNRALAREEREAFAALTLNDLDGEEPADELVAPHVAPPASERPPAEAESEREPGLAPEPVFSDEDGEGAQWVGDIFTLEYMPVAAAAGGALPAPPRRIYFATEEQARAAGYHRDGAPPASRQ
jgi:hypothetical protein